VKGWPCPVCVYFNAAKDAKRTKGAKDLLEKGNMGQVLFAKVTKRAKYILVTGTCGVSVILGALRSLGELSASHL
jgi:predicted nucleic acid-binding Zn finger protein